MVMSFSDIETSLLLSLLTRIVEVNHMKMMRMMKTARDE